MEIKPGLKNNEKARVSGKRPTIGAFVMEMVEEQPFWRGLNDAASELDANLFCFKGPLVNDQADICYDLCNTTVLDGLVTWAGPGAGVMRNMDSKQSANFFKQYSPLPIINYEVPVEGIPSIVSNTYQGMYDILAHLIEVHNIHHIVLIRGPEGHFETEERLRAYQDVLSEHGLPFDPALVSAPTSFNSDLNPIFDRFIHEGKLRPGIDFQAVAGTEASFTYEAIMVLQSRGFRVPEEIAVVGFNEETRFNASAPTITVARKSFIYEGRLAIRMLIDILNGETIPITMDAPTDLMIRRSCGCWAPEIEQSFISPPEMQSLDSTDLTAFQNAVAKQREAILAAMVAASGEAAGKNTGWANDLLDALIKEIEFPGHLEETSKRPNFFLSTMENGFLSANARGSDISRWHNVLSSLRCHIFPILANRNMILRAENLWQQAQVLIGKEIQRLEVEDSVRREQINKLLRGASRTLSVNVSVETLMNVVFQQLMQFGFPSFYVSLYEQPERENEKYQRRKGEAQKAPEWSRLMLAYNDVGRRELEDGGLPFPTRCLVPEEFLPLDRRFSMVVLPLFYLESQLGFIVLEAGPRDEIIYTSLSELISSALYGTLLAQQYQHRTLQLQTSSEVSQAASSILEPTQLFQNSVNLIHERFKLYYVGLFLLDESLQFAVLQAGTGEAGQEMVRRKHKLEVSGASMVGQCIATKKAQIAQNVGVETARFDNPLLPETRSEMALPLIARGQAIGALTVQSAKASTFTQEDVTILQTMSDQLANAIENARLFEQTQQRAAELSKARETAELARNEAEKARREAEGEKEVAERAKEEAEKARKDTEAANRSLAAQMWQTEGQALLNERMRGEQDVSTLAANVIQQMCRYLDAQGGTLYVADDDVLKLAGTYAYRSKNTITQFKLGEGPVGQAALERQTIVTVIPHDYITSIYAATGELLPKSILTAPLAYDGQMIGVIQLEAMNEFAQTQMEFLNRSLEGITVAFFTAQARKRVNELLMKTRQQAEELQAQEEELRATNEELESQAESLRASEMKLRANQAQLEAANTELEEKAMALQESSTVLKGQQEILDRQNRELRAAQQDLEQKAADLALASKYKSEFLANMSHELRTPLNSLLILASMMAKNEEGNLTPEQIESAQIISGSGTDLLNLINEILDLSKVEAGRMEFRYGPMALERLAEGMRAQFGALAQEKGLEFIMTLADDLPASIETDQQRVEQIIKNLLSNSFKFTAQGSVRLDISRPEDDTRLSRSGINPAKAIAISVTDTGIGMTPEQQKIVFEAFQQADGSTSRQYGGTGLGLTISRELATRLGGQIDLESEYGKGSKFTLYLPIEKPKTQPETSKTVPTGGRRAAVHQKPAAPETVSTGLEEPAGSLISRTPAGAPASEARRVDFSAIPEPSPSRKDDREDIKTGDKVLLVIEDDAKFTRIVYDYAHKKKFKCLVAGDGETGLKIIQTYPVDAVVLDLSLPNMSGWEVLDMLKENPDTRHIPVHIMSVSDEDHNAYKHGAIGFFSKPISQENFEGAFERIEKFINRNIRSLLLVEDDDVLRKSVCKLLDGNDVSIREVGNGQAALDLLAAQSFDCMILDLTLPDMTGFELLNRLDTDDSMSKCPVIVYTGKDLTEEENNELLKYAESVIVKGVKSPERLLDETALFLHRVIANMPEEKQRTIKRLHDSEAILTGKEVLIVDDDARNAFALSRLLTGRGLKAHIATTGQKALEMLEKTPIDLVLMDIMLPGMDGYEITRRIRANPVFRNLPILALTAKAMKGDREKCIAAGANDYLTKPVDSERLFSMLRVWLNRA